jgi:hypothetical protein
MTERSTFGIVVDVDVVDVGVIVEGNVSVAPDADAVAGELLSFELRGLISDEAMVVLTPAVVVTLAISVVVVTGGT